MTTISGDGWRVAPVSPSGSAGTGVRFVRAPSVAGLLGATALAGVGVGSILVGGPLGARMGATGLGRGIGIALGLGAVAGAAMLLHRSAQSRTEEYLVHFAAEPNLEGVPAGEVYATLRAHHERYAPAVERELAALVREEKVGSYSGIVGANGFVVDVVRRHRDEVQQRLDALVEVGDVTAAPMS